MKFPKSCSRNKYEHNDFSAKKLSKNDETILNDVFKIYDTCFNDAIKIPVNYIKYHFQKGVYSIDYLIDNLNEEVCGLCIHMCIQNINAVIIDYIAIKNNYQGKGLARLLFNYIYDTYCKKKILTLECEDHLIGFYAKLGCQLIPVFYDSGCDNHLTIMVKSNKSIVPKRFHKIVGEIKRINDYRSYVYSNKMDKLVYEKKIQLVRILNALLRDIDLLPYNKYTKEGIS